MRWPFAPGQRWVSEAEPELGLGTVVEVEGGRVAVWYPGSRERRQYAAEIAPLRRVVFRRGERVTGRDGTELVVASAESRGGLLVYRSVEGGSLAEAELADALGFGTPDERLLNGQAESPRKYELRWRAQKHQHERRRSPVRGFAGGRMDLISHQLYLAREVAERQAPRVLLADEVGLGKTIEACLIVHRLLGTGRVARVLVVVPEPLLHQWFVELLRRFNLWFHLFDEERCGAIEAAHPEGNPFLDDQWVLCGLPLLLNPRRAAQAVEAGWDLLVVDEAHHLRWSEEGPGPEYRIIEALGQRSEGLLLLTATPEQLGLDGHFARLRLLDPRRYDDFGRFREESRRYGEVARVVNRLLGDGRLTVEDQQHLHAILGAEPKSIQRRLESLASGNAAARAELVSDLLDRHGTGRVMFRNTRAAIRGFPRRIPRPAPLEVAGDGPPCLEWLAAEFDRDAGGGGAGGTEPDWTRDPRVVWLVDLLRRLKDAKVLLICRTRDKVLALDAALRRHLTVKTALFHEDLELVQRDRHAAWFAEEDGARILLASEIGSEGRNFQFAHHLVLWDLPLDPELVEQRIGRLDRIGQTADIQIHVPYVRHSAQEVLFRWYHEGLDAFGHPQVAGRELREQFGARVRDLAQDFHETHAARGDELEALIRETRSARRDLEMRLEEGRDRLLELNSFRSGVAKELVEAIRQADREESLEAFLLDVWDHYGVPVEDLGPRLYRLGGEAGGADSFPALPPGGLVATFDRRTALGREDLAFLTWDHPMVVGALDLLLGGKEGTAAFAVWPEAREPGLWLETVHLLECVAPPKLHADRFLPPTPIRVIVNGQGQDITEVAEAALARARLEEGSIHEVLDVSGVRERLRRLVIEGSRIAEARARPLVESARQQAARVLSHELERLRALAAVNPGVRPDELSALDHQRAELQTHLSGARLRLDAIRLIGCGEL